MKLYSVQKNTVTIKHNIPNVRLPIDSPSDALNPSLAGGADRAGSNALVDAARSSSGCWRSRECPMPCENAESEDAMADSAGETSRCGSPVFGSSVPSPLVRSDSSARAVVGARWRVRRGRDRGRRVRWQIGSRRLRSREMREETGRQMTSRLSLVREIGLVLIRGMVTSAES